MKMDIEILDYDDGNYTVSVAFNQVPLYISLTFGLSDLHVLKETVGNAIVELEKRISEETGNK